MTHLPVLASVLTVFALAQAPAAHAQNLGEREFMDHCAACHGASGTGDGVMQEFMNTKPSDLTVLQKNNGGVFPVSAIFETIAGDGPAGVHGTREMPAWGQRYRVRAPDQLGWDYSPEDREQFVRGRILALIEYISTLQVE
ncbi:c-type cytochrome [Pseudogemmobacter sp. W21_MBD1_M6]|uniref:c-type cytochrome n=1 Tax=Pseudogemmobacter sp. W21_MBD1_M6 TaxID=3240271 RepID=UPI003F9C6BF3